MTATVDFIGTDGIIQHRKIIFNKDFWAYLQALEKNPFITVLRYSVPPLY